MEEKFYDVIIIGSGPAGLTAATYTCRANLNTLVISGRPFGGQLMTTTDVENFPGFPEGIQGPELMQRMKEQALRFGADWVEENVMDLAGNSDEGFTAVTDNQNKIYRARSIILATGAVAKWLNIDSEQRLRGKGVSACATCDGFFFKDRVVAVVGGGDSAMEESNFLTKFATKVYVIVRKSQKELKASKIMQQRAMENPKTEFLFNTEIEEVLGTQSVEGLQIRNNLTGEVSTLEDIRGLFLAIGHKPSTDFLKDFIKLDDQGYVEVTGNTQTSKEGVFVSGDVADYRYRQAITAAGMGCMAALDVERYLAEKE